MADILRAQGDRFLDRYRSSFDFQQLKAFRAIQRCRTAALGGHRDACPSCGYQVISYNSYRNRHCPKCQAQARARWLAARERELFDTSYFHVVFTLPHELNMLALENPRLFYDLLFTASVQTLLEIASDPMHLGADSEDPLTNPTWRPPGTTKQEVAGLILRAGRYASISHYFVGPFPGRPSFSTTAGSKSLGHDSPATAPGFSSIRFPG